MMDLFRYPQAAGAQARDTSQAAASSTDAGTLRGMALGVLERSDGLTADQVAGRLGLSILSIRPRITELTHLGKVRDTGKRRRNASGRSAIVWAAVQPARLARAAIARTNINKEAGDRG